MEFSSLKEFWPFYVSEHQHPVNRALHFVGSTGVLALLGGAVVTGNPWLLVGMPVVGYGCAWVGHFVFERNRPATFKYPVYSFVSDWIMYAKTWTGRMSDEIALVRAARQS